MSHWKQREGGGMFAIWTIRTIALVLGRSVARLLLYPITLYFFLRRAHERAASRLYLSRVLGRPVTGRDVFRHIHMFAATLLDRMFFLARGEKDFRVEVEGLAELDRCIDAGRGVLLIGSHQGSFEALRALGARRPDVPLRVVLDKQKTPALTTVLEALAPDVGAAVIDASLGGASVALAMAEGAAQGGMVALLADRGHAGEATLDVPFLGKPAPFPVGPWLLASALKIPVVLCMGIYLGGNRYRLIFEAFSDGIEIPRAQRKAVLEDIVARYAARVEHYARVYPFNWFNFYDFWQEMGPAADEPAASARLPRHSDA
ncbi:MULTISPECIES: acyltransferase [unclassified Luteibacter]|uniref:LpxL/LpxP family acyltransferase n=1 Tax=unclassified Luteibacter TaxID=2620188 RepID=UPI0008BBB7EF|nr:MULTISPECIES: acyltransferase [unclassified Luteibacter]MDR6937861.1 putative LPLAT superfamily acyltransferase [Luteibacter sp. 3190]SEP02016.1 Predicted acyltransferase, LPLAT superfamily [Luteibacter sp. UNC138MFCol5.1]SEW21726.1 Predicted acyltransferase, LPLAT superfamily [Luteibacter sp. 329MFSha]